MTAFWSNAVTSESLMALVTRREIQTGHWDEPGTRRSGAEALDLRTWQLSSGMLGTSGSATGLSVILQINPVWWEAGAPGMT